VTRVPTSPADRRRWAGTSGHAAGGPVPAGGAAARAGRLNGVAGSRQSPVPHGDGARVHAGFRSRTAGHGRRPCRVLDQRFAAGPDLRCRRSRRAALHRHKWPYGTHVTDLLGHGPLDSCHAARVIAEAADALSAAHKAGLAHRARTPCRARNAGRQPVRRDARTCRRLPPTPSQMQGKGRPLPGLGPSPPLPGGHKASQQPPACPC